MAGNARCPDFDLHPSTMAAVNTQAGRLGDHNQLGPQAIFINNVLPAQAVAIFLLHGCGHIQGDIIRYAGFLQQRSGVDARGNPAFHVTGTAAIQNPVLDVAGMRITIPHRQVTGINGIDVAVQRNHIWAGADPAK